MQSMARNLYGKRVRIKGIGHESDRELNGLCGTLRPRFFEERGPLVFGDVGVWLDEPLDGAFVVNVLWNEYELLSTEDADLGIQRGQHVNRYLQDNDVRAAI